MHTLCMRASLCLRIFSIRMENRMSRIFIVLGALALVVLGTAAPAFAQTPAACSSTHTVVSGDTLVKIAQAVMGKAEDYALIVSATNAIAQTDTSFHAVQDVNVIEVGWKLCIPASSNAPATQPAASAPATAPASAAQLTGTVWKWTGSIFNDGKQTTPDDANKYLLKFLPEGRVSIKADCNQVGGTYTVKDNQLTITTGPSTLVACPPGSSDQEYLRQLGLVSSYFIKDGNLVLEFKLDSGSMTFAPSAPGGLAGSAWNVVSYNNGKQAVVSLLADTTISLNFGTDGRVSGNAGCNEYTGSYTTGGSNLYVSALATTFKLCHKPDGVMVQEQQYVTALSSASTYEIAGDTLTIRDGSGAMQVVAKTNAPQGLAGTAWDVTGYNNGKQAVVSLLNGTAITLNFGADKQVNGSSGCNNYSGGFESTAATLKVGPLAATQKACTTPEGIMVQEQQYLTALQNSATYEVSGSTLTIRDSSGAMQVTATKRAPATLAGTAWNVTNYNNAKQAVVGLAADTKITLNFGADKTVSGNAGCNTYNGGYESTDKTLKVGPLASTRMACEKPAGVMEQEALYLAALQNAATYDIAGNTLTIRDASGAMQVVATR